MTTKTHYSLTKIIKIMVLENHYLTKFHIQKKDRMWWPSTLLIYIIKQVQHIEFFGERNHYFKEI